MPVVYAPVRCRWLIPAAELAGAGTLPDRSASGSLQSGGNQQADSRGQVRSSGRRRRRSPVRHARLHGEQPEVSDRSVQLLAATDSCRCMIITDSLGEISQHQRKLQEAHEAVKRQRPEAVIE